MWCRSISELLTSPSLVQGGIWDHKTINFTKFDNINTPTVLTKFSGFVPHCIIWSDLLKGFWSYGNLQGTFSPKLHDELEKVRECQIGRTSSITSVSMVRLGLHATGQRWKMFDVLFLSISLFEWSYLEMVLMLLDGEGVWLCTRVQLCVRAARWGQHRIFFFSLFSGEMPHWWNVVYTMGTFSHANFGPDQQREPLKFCQIWSFLPIRGTFSALMLLVVPRGQEWFNRHGLL